MNNRKAPKIEALRAKLNDLWSSMLAHDGIALGSKFIVISKDNPFSPEYSKLMKEFLALKKARAARASRRDAIASLGMKEVRGALGGRYIE